MVRNEEPAIFWLPCEPTFRVPNLKSSRCERSGRFKTTCESPTGGTASGTGDHYRSYLLWKGNAVEGSNPLFLPVQTPATENQEDRGWGVTEQNLIWPAHWCISIAVVREQVHCVLTLTTEADRES